jgi:hypothetical protein
VARSRWSGDDDWQRCHSGDPAIAGAGGIAEEAAAADRTHNEDRPTHGRQQGWNEVSAPALPFTGQQLFDYIKATECVEKSVDYTLVAADAQKAIIHPSTDTTARTFTIPAAASVDYPDGTTIMFVNCDGAGDLSIAITTDTMRLAGSGETGLRTLSANGMAMAMKLPDGTWIISGTGVS